MLVNLSGTGTLYQQVYRAMRAAILDGRLHSGEQLPVSRALAAELGISRNVVLIAYDQLVAEGYVEARVGAGTFVAPAIPDSFARPSAPRRADVRKDSAAPRLSRYAARILSNTEWEPTAHTPVRRFRYDFAYYLASTEDFPSTLWRRLLVRRLRKLELDYTPVQGDAELRNEIAKYLRRSRAVECEPDQVLLVNGSQQALDLVARVLVDAGDGVVLEDPHYHGAREVFRAIGARLIPVPVDAHGLQVNRLPTSGRLRLAYVTPSHQFPTGAILPLDRRLALLSWAEKTGAYILEDDYDGEYHYEGRPLEAVQALDRAGRVVYAGTFSRSLFPSLRMGYLVIPRSLTGVLFRAKWITDQHTSFLQQAALADFMREGYLDRFVRRVRVRNAARRMALLGALEKRFGDAVEVLGAAAGIHVLARFRTVPASLTGEILAQAASRGVRVYSAAPYYWKPPDWCELVLGYGAMRESDIVTGIRLLEIAVRDAVSSVTRARA